jgi:long-subunit fatty acid transport protein
MGGIMKIQTLFVLIVSLCLVAQVAIAQESQMFVLNGSGARAAGMGNAFTGVADDATAISWNSAGLTQLYSPEASVYARFGFGSMSTDYQEINYDRTTGSSFQLNFASLVFPFSVGDLNVVGGIAYRRVLDFTQDIEETLEINGFKQISKTDNSGGIDAISPSIGVQLNEMISAGATVNIMTGSTDYMQEESGDFAEGTYESKEEYSGVGIDIGVLVKPSPTFQIGANLNLPQTLTIKQSNEYEHEFKLKIPFFFSIGAAFRASDNLTIAADYRSRAWSNAKVEFEGGEEEEFTDQNANSFHVGMEYLAQAGKSVVPLRIGFYTLPTPGVDENEDQITFSGITAGIGVILGTVILDGSFEYIFGSYVGGEENDSSVDYTVSDFRITVGGTVHFGKN